MSRIGKVPISIPTGITVQSKDGKITVKGPKGELTFTYHPKISVQANEKEVNVKRQSNEKNDKALQI